MMMMMMMSSFLLPAYYSPRFEIIIIHRQSPLNHPNNNGISYCGACWPISPSGHHPLTSLQMWPVPGGDKPKPYTIITEIGIIAIYLHFQC